MNQTMLELNDDKTALLVFTSKYQLYLYNDLGITIMGALVHCRSHKSCIWELSFPTVPCLRDILKKIPRVPKKIKKIHDHV